MANTTDLRIDIASEFTGKKAFKQAETATEALQRNVKNLGKAFGLTFAAYKITQFGKAAAAAFIQDEKAASLLANTMKNLGLELSAPAIDNFIQKLEQATGVVDDQLRPAMQTLLQVTGSVTNSQKILAQAIEVSRATGVDLTTVAQDLGQAFVGNTRGLRKYSLGLTQAELKAASFVDIQDRMTRLFGGANEAYLETYAGQMERLGVAAGEAQETIGKGLVDALITLTGSKGVDDLANKMQAIAQTTSNIIGSISRFISVTGGILRGESGVEARDRVFGKPAYAGAIPSITSAVQASQQKKAESAAVKRNKELIALQKKQLSATKAITASKKASAVFDLDQIQIVAALKGKITEEEATRLRLQSAILMGNNTEAARLTVELSKTAGMTKELSTWLANLPTAKNPFEAWSSYLDAIQGQLMKLQMPSYVPLSTSDYDRGGFALQAKTIGLGLDNNINITVEGSVITQQELTAALREGLLNDSLSAKQSNVNRQLGSFSS